ncbi:MAG: DUF480 domain-containing protein [Pirellulales bacterium]|nr:DUF480 domain-containing protein [Pirellulales bacterium]
MTAPPAADSSAARKWRPLEKIERRVAGVLIEKAKTTPDAYPLTLNSLRTGSNQKSNRFPQMELEEDHVSEAVESLARMGAVAIVQGDGRAEKYRHLLYEWLGVDKVEIAVMGELLLRGAQTLGDLRARAARMEPIQGQHDLQPIVDGLHAKGLLVYLTPPGRGCIVTHNLYQPQELAKLRSEHGGFEDRTVGTGAATLRSAPSPSSPSPAPSVLAPPPSAPAPSVSPTRSAAASSTNDATDALAAQIATLRQELAELRDEFETTTGALRRELDDLKSQLGA